MQAIRYVIPSLMQAGRFVPGMTRTFVPIARNAINAARSRLRPSWEYASRNEMREASRLANARQSLRPSISDRLDRFVDTNFSKLYGAVGTIAATSAAFGKRKRSEYMPPGNGASVNRKNVRDSGFSGFPVSSYLSEIPPRRARDPGSGIYSPVNSSSGSGGGTVGSKAKRIGGKIYYEKY